MTPARKRKANLSPIMSAIAAALLWSCAPSSESQKQPTAPANGAGAAPAAARSDAPLPTPPTSAVGSLRSGERVILCGEDDVVIELAGVLRGDRLVLRPNCGRYSGGQQANLTVQLRETRTGSGGRGRPLLNLWQQPIASRQRLDRAVDGRFLDIRLVTGTARCPAIRATPLADPPAPARVLDRYQRWDRSFAFHADADCSVLVIGIGNEAVVLETGRPRRAKLFEIQLDFLGGPNGQSSL